MNEAVSPGALSTLFTDARTHNGWRETPVSDETLREIYALMKWGPTSANCSPARIVFIRTAEGKERLRPALSSGNLQKTLTAPVTAIVAWDSEFYERLPLLFPHGDARSWFTSSPQLAEETAFRNSSMQAAYLIVACRALGLDTGPMSGFDREGWLTFHRQKLFIRSHKKKTAGITRRCRLLTTYALFMPDAA